MQTVRRVVTTVYERVLHPFFFVNLNIYIYIYYIRACCHTRTVRAPQNEHNSFCTYLADETKKHSSITSHRIRKRHRPHKFKRILETSQYLIRSCHSTLYFRWSPSFFLLFLFFCRNTKRSPQKKNRLSTAHWQQEQKKKSFFFFRRTSFEHPNAAYPEEKKKKEKGARKSSRTCFFLTCWTAKKKK